MPNVNKVVIPTGYMGSGSSAITDLLDGVKNYNVSNGSFEFVFLHCPNGVFDLEDKLLIGNNAVRSDEALHSFYKTMRQLYDKKYWWVGHYNEHIGDGFWIETEKYLSSLTEFSPEYYWYYQENVEWKMIPQLVKNKILKILSYKGKYLKKPLAYSPMWVSYIEPDMFYKISQEYIYNIFEIMGKKQQNIVLDQLLLPFNLFRFTNYFKDDVEVFVVDRDPRDVFIINKYYWNKANAVVPYPIEVERFCDFYKKMRALEKPTHHQQINRIHFEDLIYKNKETVDYIYNKLGIVEEQIKNIKTKFNPNESMNNTQLFLQNEQFKKECAIIKENLEQYIYDFPYEIKHDDKRIF